MEHEVVEQEDEGRHGKTLQGRLAFGERINGKTRLRLVSSSGSEHWVSRAICIGAQTWWFCAWRSGRLTNNSGNRSAGFKDNADHSGISPFRTVEDLSVKLDTCPESIFEVEHRHRCPPFFFFPQRLSWNGPGTRRSCCSRSSSRISILCRVLGGD